MKQRLGITQALFCRPRLLICDEPTSALDPIGRKEILDILQSVKEETTVLFSTHILSDVERICTDVALLHNGNVVLQGTIDTLKRSRSFDAFSVELCDSFAAEALLAAYPDARRGEGNTVTVSGNDARFREIMAFLVEAGITPRKMERLEPTVESLFVEVIAQ